MSSSRRASLILALCGVIVVFALAAPSRATTDEMGLRVVGVAHNDVLNMREYPTAEARIIEVIPPDGRGVIWRGERHGDWIYVSYRRASGWVHSRFLVPEVAGWISRGQRHDD